MQKILSIILLELTSDIKEDCRFRNISKYHVTCKKIPEMWNCSDVD